MSGKDPIRDRLVYPVAATVLAGWMLSLVYGILSDSFSALTVVTPVMLLLAGYVFGVNIVKTAKGESSER